jgi:predicted Holliday junction resolvase-like endonuclease
MLSMARGGVSHQVSKALSEWQLSNLWQRGLSRPTRCAKKSESYQLGQVSKKFAPFFTAFYYGIEACNFLIRQGLFRAGCVTPQSLMQGPI